MPVIAFRLVGRKSNFASATRIMISVAMNARPDVVTVSGRPKRLSFVRVRSAPILTSALRSKAPRKLAATR